MKILWVWSSNELIFCLWFFRLSLAYWVSLSNPWALPSATCSPRSANQQALLPKSRVRIPPKNLASFKSKNVWRHIWPTSVWEKLWNTLGNLKKEFLRRRPWMSLREKEMMKTKVYKTKKKMITGSAMLALKNDIISDNDVVAWWVFRVKTDFYFTSSQPLIFFVFNYYSL